MLTANSPIPASVIVGVAPINTLLVVIDKAIIKTALLRAHGLNRQQVNLKVDHRYQWQTLLGW